jgi:BirA family transcriptional regulator, biotin operon repressor / biotin---[acetyl-CoA-carboxylase] ligase
VLEQTGSTQNDLIQLISQGLAGNGEVIASEFQSAGRGRLDRNFIAPTSSALLFSLYIEPKRDRADWGFLSQLAALTLHSVIAPNLERDILLKWPNDILIEEKKVAGLLAQATDKGVVIGIGLNVSMTISELPIPHATSIAISGGKELDRNLLLANFLNTFQANFQDWDNGASFITKYTSICSTIGQEVEIEVLGRENRQGRAQGILNSGALLLADGFAVTVGDVVHLR